ncbi:MAG: ABC transporter ATP-binding protein [Actinomycetaceae bacterium]|nr:ABC transporter ATP-binding protein/permease [Arcanobacterium sp.]MDD7504755.1 ABC transporter ATP-binding protein [Actinomycetaceae bacterium]MDY6143574.1 ABC transporter ATP-binding protein [Arcanobacterium sp.]
MTLIHTAWEFFRHKKLPALLIVFFQLAQVVLSLWLPSLNARIIDDGIIPGDIPLIWRTGGLMLAISVLQILCMIGAMYLGSRTAMEFGRDLRRSVFRTVQRFSQVDQAKLGAPTLITRTTNDVTQIQQVVMLTFTVMITAPIMGIGGVIMAIRQDARLSLLLLAVVPALGLIIFFVMRGLTPRYKISQIRIDAINTQLREHLTGVRVIRAFGQQPRERKKFDTANKALRDIWLEIGWFWSILMPAASLVIGISLAAVVWFGGQRIAAGGMQVGSMTAYINYLMMILGAVMMSGMMTMMLPRGEVAAQRIKEVREQTPSITAPLSAQPLPSEPLTFELVDACLQYPGAEQPVLSHISLRITPGSTTAVIGSTASGKSSLIKLLPRLIDATSGAVYAGGINVKDADPAQLRERIAFVPQTAFLFSGTIASNVAGEIRRDAEVDRDRVVTALKVAEAFEFVEKLDRGIDAEVESGGKNFSGGQRQRLTIARAIYKCLPDATGKRGADLTIFDDSFSALDFATDARVRRNLATYLHGISVLIVAQRVSTIRNADEILVLDDGAIVGRGTHQELMRTCPTYEEIVSSQLTKEEAA